MESDERGLTREEAAERCADVVDRVETAAVVDREILETLLATTIARGHVLLEDVPGTGKSVTARVLAEALGLTFSRIQFTPDLLPADITGSNIYNEHEGTFEFAEGPVFTNVVLADEINRAPPKTQAALLEAMEERQVSVDGTTYELPRPFFVIATQNPVEQEGTFRLPEAQRDRFSVKTSIGYPDVEGEMGLLERRSNRRSLSPSVDPVTDADTVVEFQELAEDVTVEESVRRYIVDLARETRQDDRTDIGVSPRGVQRLYELSRAVAVVEGRDYVIPDDIKRLAESGMAHRVVLTTESTVEGVDTADIVRDAVAAVDVPAVAPGPDEPEEATQPADPDALADGESEHSGDAPGGQGVAPSGDSEDAGDGTGGIEGNAGERGIGTGDIEDHAGKPGDGGADDPTDGGTLHADGSTGADAEKTTVAGADAGESDQQEEHTAESGDDQQQSEQDAEPASIRGEEQVERQSNEQTE